MKTAIRAIETEYAGCRFRSRLEARWAVFFDRLGIRWNYEPEGYEFDGVRYLPDFGFPEIGGFAEVKGAQASLDRDLERITTFSAAKRTKVVILGEVPAPVSNLGTPMHSMVVNGEVGTSIAVNLRFADGFSWFFAHVAIKTPVTTEWRNWGGISPWPELIDAYAAARGARFEFGEQG